MHQELRDRKVALFVDKLPQGVWEIRYELRAEVPGSFHALPLMGHAMYVPEIRAKGRWRIGRPAYFGRLPRKARFDPKRLLLRGCSIQRGGNG